MRVGYSNVFIESIESGVKTHMTKFRDKMRDNNPKV